MMANASRVFHAGGRVVVPIWIRTLRGASARSSAASAPRLSRSPMRQSGCPFQLLKVFMGCAYELRAVGVRRLLFQQAGMAGHTYPFVALEHPCIREATHVVVGLTLITTLGAVLANHYRRGPVESDFHPLDVHRGWLDMLVFDVGQELGLVTDLAVVLSIGESFGNQRIEHRRIAVYLRLVPDVFEHHQFVFCVRSLGKSLASRAQCQQKKTAESSNHEPYVSVSSPREADTAET